MFKEFIRKQQIKQASRLTEITQDLATSFEYFNTAINNKNDDNVKKWAKRSTTNCIVALPLDAVA